MLDLFEASDEIERRFIYHKLLQNNSQQFHGMKLFVGLYPRSILVYTSSRDFEEIIRILFQCLFHIYIVHNQLIDFSEVNIKKGDLCT